MQGPCLCFPPTDPKERFFSKLAVGKTRVSRPDSCQELQLQTQPCWWAHPRTRAGRRERSPAGENQGKRRCIWRGERRADLRAGPTKWPLEPRLEKTLFRLEGSPGDSLSSKTIASSKPQGPLPLSLQVLLLGGQVGSFGFFSVFLIIEKSRPIQAKENRETPGFPSNKEAACFVVFSCFFPPQKLTHHPRNNLPREDLVIFPPIWKKVKVSVTRSWLTLWPHGL